MKLILYSQKNESQSIRDDIQYVQPVDECGNLLSCRIQAIVACSELKAGEIMMVQGKIQLVGKKSSVWVEDFALLKYILEDVEEDTTIEVVISADWKRTILIKNMMVLHKGVPAEDDIKLLTLVKGLAQPEYWPSDIPSDTQLSS